MTKTVQISVEVDQALYDQFMAAVAAQHMPAAQILQQLMRKFIALHETPNAITIAAMQAADRGEGSKFESADALFRDLEI